MKINSLEIENVKRIKAVRLEPSANGLTIIGGRNGQGKTSVLDSIAWALGGEKFRPSNAQREGALSSPVLKITMDNGLVVERKGKNSNLVVTDPNNVKSGQQLLNEFVTSFALDVPRFMNSSDKDKARVLLQIIGLEDQLTALDQEEQGLYNKRHALGQIADQKKKYADELTEYPNVPEQPINATELIQRQQDILRRNAENDRIRRDKDELQRVYEHQNAEIMRLEAELTKMKELRAQTAEKLQIAQNMAYSLVDESTKEIEEDIANIEKTNIMIRANLEKERAYEEAEDYKRQYGELSGQIEAVRTKKIDLLNSADLPLPGLSVESGDLIYDGHKWDCMSSSEQLKVATAIVRKLNPKCEFVLMDKLEQMDLETLREFGEWIEREGLQVIATRVSTGAECSVIIEDGFVAESEEKPTKWKEGVF